MSGVDGSYTIEHAELDAAVAASVWAVASEEDGAAVYAAVYAYATQDETMHWPHAEEEAEREVMSGVTDAAGAVTGEPVVSEVDEGATRRRPQAGLEVAP
jgi:hypothetical protein